VATIVLLEHQMQDRLGIHYMAYLFARRWERDGHRVLYHRGVSEPPPGDVAILHVDLTVVPESYLEVARRYPRVVNLRTADIRKSRYSSAKLARNDAWPGKVLIKTEANHGGHVDDALRRAAIAAGLANDVAEQTLMDHYYLCDSMARVPAAIWDTPGVLVERFVPERDERGYYIRIWTFFGNEERSTRYRSQEVLVRAGGFEARDKVEVPDSIRAWRERLGFDFGKLDYVLHEGEYILLDANRTPGAPDVVTGDAEITASLEQVATGIRAFL
jgi:hypothetical protein